MRDVFIASAVRTPIGTFGGAFQKHTPVDLAAPAMRAALDRADVDGAALDLFIFGNVLRGGHGQLVPRQAAIQAGIPDSIDGYAVDMVCSSGMMSLINAATTIKASTRSASPALIVVAALMRLIMPLEQTMSTA